MPIYEYRCRDCGKKSSVLTLSIQSAVNPRCRFCHGTNLEKLVSRVAVLRSEQSRVDSLTDPASLSGLDENDPKSVARWMKRMGKEMGEDAGGDFDEEMDKAMEEAGTDEGEAFGGGGGGGDEDQLIIPEAVRPGARRGGGR